MEVEDIEMVEKYVYLILDEYMTYITWDEKLDSKGKAIRKSTVQSLRKIL